MVVKRYVVTEMPEAIVQIRRDLGKDAVILSTKRVTVKRWFGLARAKRIEVLAAAAADLPVRLATTAERETAVSKVTGPSTDDPAHRAPRPSGTSAHVDASGEASLTLSGTENVSQASETRAQLDRLRLEVEALKRMLAGGGVSDSGLHPKGAMAVDMATSAATFATPHALTSSPAARLRQHGVTVPELLDPSLTWEQVHDRLAARLAGGGDAQPLGEHSRVAVFVGPTGVGKTTTIAKLAALHVLAGRRVALVTTDTFRIAAVEQLRTYARILDVPMTVAADPDQLRAAVAEHRAADLVLVDTAGRNFRDPRYLDQMRQWLVAAKPDETYLVLSLTAKATDLDTLAQRFSSLPFDKFLFTKVDETDTYGAAVNLLWEYRKPLSYVTFGQNVPDDIEIASLSNWLRWLGHGGM
jgi:flagellar biosynthesis protein FlhF